MTTPELLTALHRRRLRELWRSAGWPCQDIVEAELLAAGLLERLRDASGRETLRVTDTGVEVIAASVQGNRARRSAHEDLVARVALEMQRAGRLVWRGLRLRAPPLAEATPWPVVLPDVFSIRNSSVEEYVEPIVHEVKVSRADLLSDLRNEAKREAYRALSSQCWYVLKAGIGQADEIAPAFGVLVAQGAVLEVVRPAPRRPMKMLHAVWMALARADAERLPEEGQQGLLGLAD